MLWSLFGELSARPDGLRILDEIVARISGRGHGETTKATVLVDQSFSDFGDADVVVLLDTAKTKRCLFIEAKVRRQQTWTLRGELARFEAARHSGHALFSNLFVQLYAKQRLVEGLVANSDLEVGIPLGLGAFTRPRKIGKNEVVTRAVAMIRDYIHDATFVALVPSATDFEIVLEQFASNNSVSCPRWRALTWEEVRTVCADSSCARISAAFEFNRGQID